MNKKQFKKEYKKLQKLMKKGECIDFIGIGYIPICKAEYRLPIMKQMEICMEHEPFVDYLRGDIDD